MSLEYEVTPPRFFARVRRVPWAAPTSAEYFCAERVALWRKNGRSKCSREIWVTELRTRRQGGLARFNDTSGLASFAESPSIKFHPYGYLSSLRRPSTTTASSSAFFDETKTGIDPTLGNGETVRFSIDERRSRFVETFRRVSAYEMMTSWPFSTIILSFDEWGDTWKKSILEEVNLEFGKLEFLDFFLHCIRVLDIDIGIISEVILFWICC